MIPKRVLGLAVLLSASLLLAALAPCAAQFSISGTVTDGNGHGLLGVTVTVPADTAYGWMGASATTAADGTYTIWLDWEFYDWPVDPTLTGYAFTPTDKVFTVGDDYGAKDNVTGINFVGGNYTISGTVTDTNGKGLPDVDVVADGDTTYNLVWATTDADGTYSIGPLAPDTYDVEASLTGYSFTPSDRWPTVTNADVPGINFVGHTYTISGTVTDTNGNGLYGVTVTATTTGGGGGVGADASTAGSATTAPDGTYTITGLAPDTYTVTPSLTGYVFIPSDQSVPVTNANVPGINFVGYNYTISGTVTDTDGNGLPGVTVTASGTPTSATTDFDGTYTLYVVAGTYTVTPSLTGYDFTPSNQSVPATNANVPGINFVIHSYSISGTVTHANGEGFAGVGVVAVGTSTYTEATTDFFGNYTIGPLAPDTYVVYPSLTGYVFTPSDQSVPVTNADVPGIDFTVVPPVVVSTTPANNATGVKVRTKIKVVFSHPMNEAATQSAFSLSALTGVFGWSTDGQTLTFTSLGALAYGTNYVISVRSSAQSAVGVPLTPSYSSHFRTVYRPVVVSTTPANNATGVAVGTQITVVFSQTMNKSATQGAFSLKNGTALVAGTFSWGTLNKPMTFTPSAPLLPATKYTLTITTSAKSVVTNLAAPYSSQFTTAPAPVVVSATPANNATGVALSAPVTVTFSEAMTPVVTHNAFSLKNGTTIVAGTFSWDPLGKSMTFTPSAKLLPATNYTLTITTGAQSATGGPLAAPYSAQFTTAPPPTVLATWPANNVTGAAVNAPVQVSFSEAMLPVVTQNAFRLKNGTTSVAGAFSWSQLYKLMTFTPKAALLPATTYMLTITTGAQSAVGGPLAAPYPAQFTTGAAPASAAAVAALAAPVLAAPEDGATGVSASPRLAWEAVAGAAGYLVQVATDEGFTSKVFVAQVTDVQQQLRGLAAGSVYYWRVQAYTNDTTSPWSEVGTFTTGSG